MAFQSCWGVLSGFPEAGKRPSCLLAGGVVAAEILGPRTNRAACSSCSVPAVLAALGGWLEFLGPDVEMVVEAVAPSPTLLCDNAAPEVGPTVWEGAVVTLCGPPTAGVEGSVLGGVKGACVDGVWVQQEDGGLESWRVVLWSQWHTLGSWDSGRGAEKAPGDPAAGAHRVSAALEGKLTR